MARLRSAAVPAWAADVVSSNIVGYKKVTLAADNYTLLAPMFTCVGGGDKAIPDIFAEDDFVASDTASDADFIELWEDGAYSRKFFFSSDANNAWSSDQDGYDETDETIEGKLGFWFYNRDTDDKEVTLAGEVPTEDVEVVIAGDNYTLIGNPFAAPLPIKSIVAVSGAFTASDTASDADFIELWEDGGYSRKYFFSSDAGDAWSSDQDGYDETDDTIPAGLGFWFYRQGSEMTVKLPVPYSL